VGANLLLAQSLVCSFLSLSVSRFKLQGALKIFIFPLNKIMKKKYNFFQNIFSEKNTFFTSFTMPAALMDHRF